MDWGQEKRPADFAMLAGWMAAFVKLNLRL